MDFLRFWKEIGIILLWVGLFFKIYKKYDWSLKKMYHKNTLLGLTTAFIGCSALYMYFPFFELRPASVLWFRYDVFFFFAFIIGLFLQTNKEDLRFYLRTLFVSTFGILVIFLPWYLFWDISKMATDFWYSSQVSMYEPDQCLSFSQNVEWHHRFQATFWGPIRMSVFFTMVGTLFLGWLLSTKNFSPRQKKYMGLIFYAFLLPGIFYSYSKTSMLWGIFSACIFTFLSYRYVYGKKLTKKMYFQMSAIFSLPIILIIIAKWEMFLHLWAIINRLDNLRISLEMFFYNPIGYGLGIAGPASQIWNSIESAGTWQIAAASILTVHRFLPENWYVQILLEQGIVGFTLFVSLIVFIWMRLLQQVKLERDFISVSIFTAYLALCFMALFTHVYEEAATSYILFFFVGTLLAKSMFQGKSHAPKKK